MDFSDYIDENGKVWTHYSLPLQDPRCINSAVYRQQKLDIIANEQGWAVYVSPDPYQERTDN